MTVAALTQLPPDDLEPIADLSAFLDQFPEAALEGPDGNRVRLPLEVYNVLSQVVHAMGQGLAITVAPMERRLTTQQAADFLGISRPTLIKYLDGGELPHERLPGSRHRKIRLHDLLEFQTGLDQRRQVLLNEMSQEAQDQGLDNVTPDAYSEALKRARKKNQAGEPLHRSARR